MSKSTNMVFATCKHKFGRKLMMNQSDGESYDGGFVMADRWWSVEGKQLSEKFICQLHIGI